MEKQITLQTKPNEILEQFKDIFNNGGSINLNLGNGNYIFGTGAQPHTIVCKIENGKHYSFQRDKEMWVEI